MSVEVEIMSGSHMQLMEMQIDLGLEELSFPIYVDPLGDDAGETIIRGSAGEMILLDLPSKVELVNRKGDIIILDKIEVALGDRKESEEMRLLSDSQCGEIRIPDSGELIIRIGGYISSEERMSGIFQGNISLSSECI